MPELLLELGCEELPASFVVKACEDLRANLASKLAANGIEMGPSETYGTPRRLIVGVQDLPERQPDSEKVLRGPSVAAAYDAQGLPTKALEGFCRGQGVEPAHAYRDGDYVWVRKHEAGRPMIDVLADVIPAAITAMTFAKTMRWGGYRLRFARPIRWILASLAGQVVPFEIEGVKSGLESRGHRFNHRGTFPAPTLSDLMAGLRERDVEPDPAVRKATIRAQVTAVAGGMADLSESLVDENAFLTEWPQAVLGAFDSKYLELPEPVLVTVMAKHERFFPVRRPDGRLDNKFVSIRNGGVAEVVADGNAWVLNARFNDAKFFYDEDRKRTLDAFLEATEGIVFQVELGTVRDRANRLSKLTMEVVRRSGGDESAMADAKLAGLYAKADLSTGLVGELDELQGIIGGLYAEREGLPGSVCRAISTHYAGGTNELVSRALVVADQLDKLAGYLGLGLTPSGSSDPYGLRRAAGMVMEQAVSWEDGELDLAELLEAAAGNYQRELDPVAIVASAREVLRQRCETLFPEVRGDVLEAVLVEESLVFRPAELKRRIGWMTELAQDVPFVQAATRALNIVAAAEKKGVMPDGSASGSLDSAEGDRLREAAQALTGAKNWPSALRSLQGPIDAFFDSTMVMADDPAVRNTRLAMLREVCDQLLRVGDFSKLVING